MSSAPVTELPTGYLLQNCRRVLTWVSDLYADLLSTEEADFFHRFSQLPADAQSLYVRLLTRKGPLLAIDSLNYVEVPSTETALDSLSAAGFASRNPAAESQDYLSLLTKPELVTLALEFLGKSGANRMPRSALADQIITHIPSEKLQADIAQLRPCVRAEQREIFNRFLLLFFGNQYQDLSEFVITDLGHVRYENYAICRQTRYFNSRDEIDILQSQFKIEDQLQDEAILQDATCLLELHAQLPDHADRPELQRRHERIANTIARQLERLEQPAAALAIYRQCQQHPSRERQARILAKQQRNAEAFAICESILHTSQHPEEREFAAKFGATLARKLNTTLPLQDTTETAIDGFHLQLPCADEPVEFIAATALTDEHHTCLYVENSLFNSLFGLYCWDIVFAPIPGAFFHPFQSGPRHLRSEFFHADRRELLTQRLAEMDQPNWTEKLWRHFHHKQGIANPFVFWDWLTPELIELSLRVIPASHLRAIFRQISLHPGFYGSGFPDLIRFSTQPEPDFRYELIEVKGPGDRLQPNQRRWFARFHEAGIPARLLNVTWQE